MGGAARIYLSVGVMLYFLIWYWLSPFNLERIGSGDIYGIKEPFQIVWIVLNGGVILVLGIIAISSIPISKLSEKLDKLFKL